MISNKTIETFLDCQYKTFLIHKGEVGIKNEFEIMKEDIKNDLIQNNIKRLVEKYGEQNVLKDFKFDSNIYGKNPKIAIPLSIQNNKYSLIIDGLELHFGKVALKKGRYLLVLFSDKEKISKREKLILTIQSIVVSRITGLNFSNARIYYGKEMKTLRFKISRFLLESERILTIIEKIIFDGFEPILCKKDYCRICEFEAGCKAKLEEKDDLSLLSCIGEKELLQYEKKGIFSVKQLSYTFKPRRRNEKIKNNRNPYYASLQALAIRENKVYVYDQIQLPSCKTKVYLDFEGDTESRFIYLIGILIENESNIIKHSLWADSKEDEQSIFNELIKIISDLKEPHIFYYGKYDWRVLKRLSSNIHNLGVKNLFLNDSSDILIKIRRNIYFPTYSNSLKEIGKFLGCIWSNQQASGLQSIVWRFKWERCREELFKNSLIQYNQEDCIALKKLVDFLYTLGNEIDSDKESTRLDNVFFVKNLEPKGPRQFKNMEYALPDIEVITKGAYFEYQRNKIYFRTNDKLRRIKKNTEKKFPIKYKPNKVVNIKVTTCPYCHNRNLVIDIRKKFTKTCVDLRFFKFGIKRYVTKYESFQYNCSVCKHKFASPQLKKIRTFARRGYIRKSYYLLTTQSGYGQNVISWVIYLNVVSHVPFGILQKNFQDFFDISLLKSDIWGFKMIAANYYKNTYNKIIHNLISGNLLHVDETKVKLRDKSGYIWVFTNMEEVIYLYRPNRESGFLLEMFNGFDGILVSDFFPGYDSLNCKKQRCLIHLIRNLNDELLKNPFDEQLKEIVSSFGTMLRDIIYTSHKYGLKCRFLRKHKKQITKFYKNLKSMKIESEITEKIKKRLIDYDKELFTFLDFDGIPWNNNNAEYSIKHFAEYRNSMKGVITENGLEAYLILLSIYQTCKYKGINFLEFLLSKEKDIDKFQASSKR